MMWGRTVTEVLSGSYDFGLWGRPSFGFGEGTSVFSFDAGSGALASTGDFAYRLFPGRGYRLFPRGSYRSFPR